MGFLKGIKKYKVRGLMGLGVQTAGWAPWVGTWGQAAGIRTHVLLSSLHGELREIQPHNPGKIPQGGLGAVPGTFSHSP